MAHKPKKQMLSGSVDPAQESISLIKLNDDVKRLKAQLADLSLGLKYLADANMEVSRDLESLFIAIKEIAGDVGPDHDDDPFAAMLFPFFPKKDDDLVN